MRIRALFAATTSSNGAGERPRRFTKPTRPRIDVAAIRRNAPAMREARRPMTIATSARRSTAPALATGSLWGGPMWGTYWEWDPRIIFELVLLVQFLGYIGLRAAVDDTQRADRICAVRRLMEDSGWTGMLEAEIFSTADWWRRPAEEVVRTCQDRIERCC